jgi:HrpA-like RNA helicase
MTSEPTQPVRGISATTIREVVCKDCLREQRRGILVPDDTNGASSDHFEYNEAWAQRLVDRGGSRTDRCSRHRQLHRSAVQGIAVAYIEMETIGEVTDRTNPTGPLTGLGPMPEVHKSVTKEVDLAPFKFGMDDNHIRQMLDKLKNPEKRVLILRAGTGTGKSTFGPFRLLCPPHDVDFHLTDCGPIIVTEPRVQATTGVATFVGERLVMGCPLKECDVHGSFDPDDQDGGHPGPELEECVISDCARHIGPGYRVGYQVAGDKNHDDACQLIYVTDGTMINWLREGRLNKIGAVIVDEAHERSTNIDFILGYLGMAIDRYPHLRVIVTSATFDLKFYEDYFGGPERVETMDIPAEKAFGYGSPLFPQLAETDVLDCGCDGEAKEKHREITDFETWLTEHWREQYGPELEDGSREDLWATSRILHQLRSSRQVPTEDWAPKRGKRGMPEAVAEHVISLVNAFDDHRIGGDILAFLPSNRTISTAVDLIRAAIPSDRADVYSLIQSADKKEKKAALASRPRGAKRKIVVSTNLAETSLTVSGVRFVVDSGLTTQGEWDPVLASKTVPTKPHSQSGIRQRWGRVGRDTPGWVFPLYTRSQFDELLVDTPPGSTRDNLEQLVIKAKAGGIDDVAKFRWPARHEVPGVAIDERVKDSMATFEAELMRAQASLAANGALDPEFDLTDFGKELDRFGQHSASFAVATMYADQLACVPEVVTALALLEDQKRQGYERVDLQHLRRYDRGWPPEWRLQAVKCHDALAVGARDDVDQVIRIMSAWERADPTRKPWEPSPERAAWSDRWFLDNDVLVQTAEIRRDVLTLLSPAMKEEVKRFIEPKLTPRARAAITRAFGILGYKRNDSGGYDPIGAESGDRTASVSPDCMITTLPDLLIPLSRVAKGNSTQLENVVEAVPWALDPSLSAMDLVLQCADQFSSGNAGPGDIDQFLPLVLEWPVGSRVELDLDVGASGTGIANVGRIVPGFGLPPADQGGLADEDDELGLPADSSELAPDTGWPTGNDNPREDQELLDRQAIIELDDDRLDESTGRDLGWEANDDTTGGGADALVDVLGKYSGQATPQCVMATYPNVVIEPHVKTPGRYEVVGYAFGPEGSPSIRLEADWQHPEATGDPARHDDLIPGRQIAVTVGRMLRDRYKDVREFVRADGRGRFLLEELDGSGRTVTHQFPTSTDPYYGRFLASMVAGSGMELMVIPAIEGGKSISMIPALHMHIANAATESKMLPGKRGQRPIPRYFWPAIVLQLPSGKTWGRAELAHRDTSAGVVHSFGFAPRHLPEGTNAEAASSVLLQLSPVRTSLDCASDEAEALAAQHPSHLSTAATQSAKGPGYRITSKKPITNAIRDRLLDFDDSADWKLAVWQFFVRSHLRRVQSVILSPTRSIVERGFSPIEASAEAFKQFEIGRLVLGRVASVSPTGIYLEFEGHVRGYCLPEHGPRHTTLVVGQAAIARVHFVDPTARELHLNFRNLVTVRMEVPEFWDGLLTGGHNQILRSLDASIITKAPRTIVAGFETKVEADDGIRRLSQMFRSPGVLIGIPTHRIAAVIGDNGARIREVQDRSETIVARLDNQTATMTLISEDFDGLRAAITQVAEWASQTTGTMTVHDERAMRRLIGKRGNTVTRLRSESGCDFAQPIPGTLQWALRARSPEAIERFVAIANEVAPGCHLDRLAVEEPVIRDAVTGEILADWRNTSFAVPDSPPLVLDPREWPLVLWPASKELSWAPRITDIETSSGRQVTQDDRPLKVAAQRGARGRTVAPEPTYCSAYWHRVVTRRQWRGEQIYAGVLPPRGCRSRMAGARTAATGGRSLVSSPGE